MAGWRRDAMVGGGWRRTRWRMTDGGWTRWRMDAMVDGGWRRTRWRMTDGGWRMGGRVRRPRAWLIPIAAQPQSQGRRSSPMRRGHFGSRARRALHPIETKKTKKTKQGASCKAQGCGQWRRND